MAWVGLAAVLAACTSHPSTKAPGSATQSSSPSTTAGSVPITRSSLWAAEQNVATCVPQGQAWWPAPPITVDVGPLAGETTFAAEDRVAMSGGRGVIETRAILYDNVADAHAAFQLFVAKDAGQAVTSPLSIAGDETASYTASVPYKATDHYSSLSPLNYPDLPFATTVRFRSSNANFRVTWRAATAYPAVRDVALCANSLWPNGRSGPGTGGAPGSNGYPPFPSTIAALMPPSVPAVGTVRIEGALQPQAWALVDNSNNPTGIFGDLSGSLQDGGPLAYREYAVAGDVNDVVEVTLFPFRDAPGAQKWVSKFLDQAKQAKQSERLDAGNTGSMAAFLFQSGDYELQFAKASVVGDVFCGNPGGTTGSACMTAARSLAEAWYGVLPS